MKVVARRIAAGTGSVLVVLVISARFLWMCQGYYRHSEGYTPEWAGMADMVQQPRPVAGFVRGDRGGAGESRHQGGVCGQGPGMGGDGGGVEGDRVDLRVFPPVGVEGRGEEERR